MSDFYNDEFHVWLGGRPFWYPLAIDFYVKKELTQEKNKYKSL